MRERGTNGFTLIEVLVSLAIFGILSIMAYQALGQALFNADLLNERMDRLRSIQQTMRLLGKDLMQATPRPVRDALGGSTIASIRSEPGTEFALEVTRGGWPNPAGLPRSTLQRATYRIEDGELLRYHWNVLDPTISNEPIVTVLLDDVDSIVFNYLEPGGDWTNQWPPFGATGSPGLRMRPQVVEIVLTLNDEGEIRRFFEVAP
ncbi:MAG: type II secretion system minor pseudopilin GspJ [Gammaproteobacteria bacterium]|nr:type II secretion system minor pseudopilin GspJ [Gammaproteobacteria bacterium]